MPDVDHEGCWIHLIDIQEPCSRTRSNSSGEPRCGETRMSVGEELRGNGPTKGTAPRGLLHAHVAPPAQGTAVDRRARRPPQHEPRAGRVEQRTLKVVTIRAGSVFPLRTPSRPCRSPQDAPDQRPSAKWTTVETVHAVTSSAANQARPAELATRVRGHWTMDTRLHWVRDVTLMRTDRRCVPVTHHAP